jgi:hypothetical protein
VSSVETADLSGELDSQSKQLVDRIQQQERAALLEYVAKRKLILDLLSKYQGFDQEEDRLNYLEQAIHRVICPTKITSNDIDIFDHNLWVIDDRLTFYDFWASDKEIRTFAAESDSQKRPDIILFRGAALFQRPGGTQPVVIWSSRDRLVQIIQRTKIQLVRCTPIFATFAARKFVTRTAP